jgi:hypothetical protein
MLPLLKDLICTNPFVDEIDFKDKGIHYIDTTVVELLGRFTELRKVSFCLKVISKCRLICKITRFESCRPIYQLCARLWT